MGYRTANRYPEFGDGNDGAIHLQSNATMDQAGYNFSSLEIDAGVTFSAPEWSVSFIPIITIRCRTPIVLNGKIAASDVTGVIEGDDGRVIIPTGTRGQPAAMLDGGDAEIHYAFPMAGGGGAGDVGDVYDRNGLMTTVGYDGTQIGGDASAQFAGDRDAMIGPGRPWRYCVGSGGAPGGAGPGTPGGNGGGILLICVPAILFGPSGAIEAKGGDGQHEVAGVASCGGGGGYVELNTLLPVSGADWAKVSVSGGARGIGEYDDGGAGLDGHKLRRLV